jgi:hypothetical protein
MVLRVLLGYGYAGCGDSDFSLKCDVERKELSRWVEDSLVVVAVVVVEVGTPSTVSKSTCKTLSLISATTNGAGSDSG